VDFDPSSGEPTGITRDFWNYIPVPEINEKKLTQAIENNIHQYLSSNGITSIHDLPETILVLKIYQDLLDKRTPHIRIRFYYEVPNMIKMDELIASGLSKGFGNEFLRLGGIKIFVDGGISSALACFYEAYDYDKTHFGKLAIDQETLNRYVLEGNKAGLQVLMHAAGDKSTDMALEAVERAQEAYFVADHRHRIEHFGNLNPQMHRFRRAKTLGVLPAPNMGFISSFGDQLEYLLGEERSRSSFWGQTLIQEGFKIPGCSDHTGTHPENTNPFYCISCAVNRRTFFGKICSEEERITVTEAIKMYTNYAAYAGFEENEKGSLELGKLGDLIILSHDPWEVLDSEIADIKVVCTIVGGKIIYNPAGL
jgi:predicted amidohydrolase YtcJ